MNTEERLALRQLDLDGNHGIVDLIRESEKKAVTAERERCAKIAREFWSMLDRSERNESANGIRRTIGNAIAELIMNGDL